MDLTTSNPAPALSVVMPVYNAARWLRECMESILSQDFTDFELIVADDGSTDDSRAIVRSFADARIRLLELPHDYIGTLNRMLAEARGRYICRMDADDLMVPGRLRRMGVKYGNKACRACRIFPICHGGCSQTKLEAGDREDCLFGLDDERRLEIIRGRLDFILKTKRTSY